MTEEEAADILIENPLRGAMCMARIEFMDQLFGCPAKLRSDCQVCGKFEFLSSGGGGGGFYYLPFATDEDAFLWSLTGHVRHQLVDISDGRLIPLVDKLTGLQMRKAALEAQFFAQFGSILESLPEWESAHD